MLGEHSTALHSTAQHSTAQCSTAYCSTYLDLILHISDLLLLGFDLLLELFDLVVQHKLELLQFLHTANSKSVVVATPRSSVMLTGDFHWGEQKQ